MKLLPLAFLFLAPGAFVPLTLLSTGWSADPGITFRRRAALLATTLFVIDFTFRHSIHEQLRRICFVLGLAVLLSVVVQVCWPGSTPAVDATYGEGSNGVFEKKGGFARIIVLFALAFITAHSGRRTFVENGLVVFCAFALIGATQSKSALVVLAASLSVRAAIRMLFTARHPRLVWLAVLVTGLPGFYLASTNLEYLAGTVGRDATLTGRVGIWDLACAGFLKKPLFGHGYSAFWNTSPEALKINSVLHWAVPHAHNGLLDLALQIGLVGLFVYLAYFAISVRRAVEYARSNLLVGRVWPLAFLAFTLLYSITEDSPLASNSMFWIVYASVACSLAAPALHPARAARGGCANFRTPA